MVDLVVGRGRGRRHHMKGGRGQCRPRVPSQEKLFIPRRVAVRQTRKSFLSPGRCAEEGRPFALPGVQVLRPRAGPIQAEWGIKDPYRQGMLVLLFYTDQEKLLIVVLYRRKQVNETGIRPGRTSEKTGSQDFPVSGPPQHSQQTQPRPITQTVTLVAFHHQKPLS